MTAPLSPQTIRIVKETAPVVAEHAEAITRRFYGLMFNGNPEVQVYFNPAHQHSGGQQRALAGAICAYAANIENLGALGPAVELIAQKHCSLGIQPEHYPIVGKHLLVAIKDVLGDAATDEIISAWAEAYGFLAEVFTGREQQIYETQRTTPGGWNGYRPFIVSRKVVESEIITSIYLTPKDGGEIASFLPGQYITVKIGGSDSRAVPRNYSLSDRPGVGHYRISVKREPACQAGAPDGEVSNYLHDQVREGDTLEIGPPCGEFVLDLKTPPVRPIVLVSGGIGITPLLSMLKHLVHQRVDVPVYFIHGARNSRVHALAPEIRTAAAAASNVHVHFRYDTASESDIRNKQCDDTGIIDIDLLQKLLLNNNADFYFCGPKPFMVGLFHGLNAWGVPDDQIHFEFFGPRQDLAVVSPKSPPKPHYRTQARSHAETVA